MTNPISILILIGGFMLLLMLKVPIAFALMIAAFASAWYHGIPLSAIGLQLINGVGSFSLLAIPFFIIAGNIMGEGGISTRLVTLADVLIGRVRGGLAMVNVLSSKFFGTVSGSAVADTSALGTILIPMMKKQGYDMEFTVANTVSSSIIGLLIPPSHNMIIYVMAAGGGISVAAMFMAGIVPALIAGIGLMAVSYYLAIKRNYPKGNKYTFKEGFKAVNSSLLGLMTIVIITGGIVTGIFTATEASVIGAIYAFIITFFVYREIPLRAFWGIMKKSFRTTATVMAIISASSAFGHMMAVLQVPAQFSEILLSISDNPVIVLLLINVLIILLGLFMDMAPMLLIGTPILLPIAVEMGMHPVQFGILILLNLGIGLITPPVGTVLFVGCSIGKLKVEQAIKPLLPYYLVFIITLLLITFVPQITLWLPAVTGN